MHAEDVVLRHGENDGDRLKLRNDGDARLAGRLHEVPHIDESQADPPAERSRDVTVRDVQFGAGDGRQVGFHGPLVLAHQRDLSVVRLRGDRFGLQQLDVADQILFGLREGGLVAGQLPLRLGELHLVRPRINLHQGLVGFDHLAFGEIDLHDLAVDPRADRRRLKRRHRSQQARQIEVDVPPRHRCGDNRNRPRRLGGHLSLSPEEIEVVHEITAGPQKRPEAESSTASRGRPGDVSFSGGACS